MMFNIFKCDFFTKVNCAFLLHLLYELSELSEVYAFKQKTALLIRYSFNVIFHKNKNLFFNLTFTRIKLNKKLYLFLQLLKWFTIF